MTRPGAAAPPAVCGVVGGGRMGAGIAHALLLAGSSIVVVEQDADAAAAARERVSRAVRISVSRGALEQAEPVLLRLTTSTDLTDLAAAGLVVEAVPEDLELKRATLLRIEAVVTADAVLGTNTSSLSLAAMGAVLRRPERLMGLHFFNPVPASRLVEVVIASRTYPALADRAAEWVRGLGKTPVVVQDSPGFASSRLGVALGLEAIRMLAEGVASAADIDAAMSLGYGHPMGPLRLTDLVGLDVRLGIARYLQAELGERFAPPNLLVAKVARGELGRKTGRGFYEWTEDEPV